MRRMLRDKKSFEEIDSPHQCFEIRLKGHVDQQWADWFEDLTITLEDNGDTLLAGFIVDQAALHGLLKKVRDLGIPLISINPIDSRTQNFLRGGYVDQSDSQ